MLSSENKDSFPKHADVLLSEIRENTNLHICFLEGQDAYRKGISYQWCRKIVDSLEEHAWQRGWDSLHFGDVRSISSFQYTEVRDDA